MNPPGHDDFESSTGTDHQRSLLALGDENAGALSSIATSSSAPRPSHAQNPHELHSGAASDSYLSGGIFFDPMTHLSVPDSYGYPYGFQSQLMAPNMTIPSNAYDVADTRGRVHGSIPSAPAIVPHRILSTSYGQYGTVSTIELRGVQAPVRPSITSSAALVDEAVLRSVETPKGGTKRHRDQALNETLTSKRPLRPYRPLHDSAGLNASSYPGSFSAFGGFNGNSTFPPTHGDGTPFSGISETTQPSLPISHLSSAAHLPMSSTSPSVPQLRNIRSLYEHTQEKVWYVDTDYGEFKIEFRSPRTRRQKAKDNSRTDRKHGVSSVDTKVSTLSQGWEYLVEIMEKHGVQNIPATPAFLSLTEESKLISVIPLRCLNDMASKLALLMVPLEAQSDDNVQLTQNFINQWLKSLVSLEAQMVEFNLALLIVTKLELKDVPTMTSCERLNSDHIGPLAMNSPYMKYHT